MTTLTQGSDGPAVKDLQQKLTSLGYSLRGTGYFGSATEVAVRSFQKTAGLAVDGAVGPRTAAALDAVSVQPRPATALPAGTQPVKSAGAASVPIWVTAALSLVGTKEVPGSGDNRQIIEWAKDLGGDIERAYTHDSVPWCALFMNHVMALCEIRGTGTLWALDFAEWGQKLEGPAVGALAPMKRQGGGHIPMVVGRDHSGHLMCVGGNQSDAVNVEAFVASRVVSYRWPPGMTLPTKTGFDSLPYVSSDGKISTHEA